MPKPAPCAIEPHYHFVRVLHKNLEATRNVIALIPGQAEPQRRPGLVYLDPEIPPENDKHIALGKFMDTWSKFEAHLRLKLEDFLLTADDATARAVSYSLSGKALMDMLLNLASRHLKRDRVPYTKLSERFGKLNTKRNYLVHGFWAIELIVFRSKDTPHVNAVEVREYAPIDTETRDSLNDLRNQKARTKYQFTLPQINQAERDVAALNKDFATFHATRLVRQHQIPHQGSFGPQA